MRRKPSTTHIVWPGRGVGILRSLLRRPRGLGGVCVSSAMCQLSRLERQVPGRCVDSYSISFSELSFEHFNRQRIEDLPLNGALQGTRAVGRVVPFGDQQVLRAVGDIDLDLAVLK